jgi:hypothetical protein
MKVGLFLGEGQYSTAGFFLRALGQAWRDAGHEVYEIVIGDQIGRALQQAAEARIELLFSYNAFGSHLQIRDRSVYDLIGARFVGWLVDHPVHHRERLARIPAGSLIAAIDPTHLAYLPLIGVPAVDTLWLPHFACAAADQTAARDLGVLVPGSIHNRETIRAQWQARPELASLVDALLEHTAGQDRIVWHDALHSVRGAVSATAMPSSGAIAGDIEHLAIAVADRFVRASRRAAALDALRRAGIRATICGQVEAGVAAIEGHDLLGPVPFVDLLRLMTRARVVIDTGAAFPSGSHERGLSAMGNGAVAIVEDNGFWDRFTDRQVQRFSWQQLDRLAADVSTLTGDAAWSARSQQGRDAVAREHTAAHRAAAVVAAIGAAHARRT